MNKSIFFSIFIAGFLCTFSSCKKDKSECLTCPPPGQDTTSHAIQWQTPDTLGAQGLIRDVWVFDRNNAWAVGEIYLNDSTGKPNMANPYNAAHWDGLKWQLMKVPVRDFGGAVGNYALYSIIGYQANNVWFVGDGDLIEWNGATFEGKAFFATSLPFNGQVRAIWGRDASNLFCVGRSGAIYQFNGTTWTKMTSNTTVDLQDIWGIDGSHIWATGTNVGDGHCVVLQCNGTSWTTLYDSNTQPLQSQYQFGTLWTNTPSSIYLDGGSGTHILTLNGLNIGVQIKTGLSYVGSSIRGVNQNDIFDITTGGEIAHYNGSSWYCYSEIQAFNKSGAWFTRIYPTSDFVLIGGWYLTAYNSAPVVIRGYR